MQTATNSGAGVGMLLWHLRFTTRMAVITHNATAISIGLGTAERFGALHQSFEIPIDQLTAARVSTTPGKELRGWRAPGTGLPGVVLLGTWRAKTTKDFAAIYRSRPSVVLELDGTGEFNRVVVSVDNAEAVAHELAVLRSR